MTRAHRFEGELRPTGSAQQAEGKLGLERAFTVEFPGTAPLAGSSPAVFDGDERFHNPETLMVSSPTACHRLTYLAVCERAGIALDS
ncbi:MAG: hypothetical protein ACK4V1_09165 [Burkholderiaceae bacterium]